MTLPVGRRSIPNTAPCIKSLRLPTQPATNLVQGAFLCTVALGDTASRRLVAASIIGATHVKEARRHSEADRRRTSRA
jgi:hypothetical protein